MVTIHIEQDEQGIIVAVDDNEPQQVESVKDVCELVMSTLGGGMEDMDGEGMSDKGMGGKMGMSQGEEMMDQLKRGYNGPAKQGGYV